MVAASQTLHLVSFWVNLSKASATLKSKRSFSRLHATLNAETALTMVEMVEQAKINSAAVRGIATAVSPIFNIEESGSSILRVEKCDTLARCLPTGACSSVIVPVTPTPPARVLSLGRPSSATNAHAWGTWRRYAWRVSIQTTHVTVALATHHHVIWRNSSNTPHLFEGIL